MMYSHTCPTNKTTLSFLQQDCFQAYDSRLPGPSKVSDQKAANIASYELTSQLIQQVRRQPLPPGSEQNIETNKRAKSLFEHEMG